MTDLRGALAEFGADPSGLLLLDDEVPELLPYATLTTARRSGDGVLKALAGVYEWQGEPLAFLVDAELVEEESHLQRLRRLLAMRGDASYVAAVAPGTLHVYRIALDSKSMREARLRWPVGADARSTVFARLGNMRPQAAITNRGWISSVVLRLLSGSTNELIELNVSHEDAISLVGRALFTRFLADRRLLPERMSDAATAAGLFDDRGTAARTSRWLDATFNGDLLPLSAGVLDKLPMRGYGVLGDVLRRAPEGQLFLGWEEKWGNLDFAHIPVGVLSQAYELYLRQHAPIRQRREGGYFTPRPIAELMVRASFGALDRGKGAKSAKVLDPAVGGGIFLLTAFRELVAEHWRVERRRPDTETLRRILYHQLVGFDVNESALRFAALGLYLLSIELDPDPQPVDKLRFEDLRGTVLHRVKGAEEEEDAALGSLGRQVGNQHVGRYDLVIGNPPWASGTKLPGWKRVRATVARIAAERGIATEDPPLPNEALDLPFVWRAMEWAKPGGQIAFALHARLLFRQGDGMPRARQALFQALDVTSVINGAELRQTKVWPQISAPFCIVFARNERPGVEAGFRFISPRVERSLNGAGGMRVDALNAAAVASRDLADTPEILKILFRGSKADLGILERMRAQGHPTLYEFWRKRIGGADRRRLRGSGNGFQTLKPSSRIRRGGDGLPGADAGYLRGLPEITAVSFSKILVDTASLDVFTHRRVHDPRSRELFEGPLVVVHKSPPAKTGRIGVAIADQDVAFNQTFYGYSPVGYADAARLVRYLALVLGSKLVVWLALMTGGEFGFEREVIEKETLDRLPLPDFEELGRAQRADIDDLVAGLESERVSWDEVDQWVTGLYGLGNRDLQVISDTLEFNLPFAENRRRAEAEPTAAERENFCQALRENLKPWCDRFGTRLRVEEMAPLTLCPWHGIRVGKAVGSPTRTVPLGDWAGLLKAADEAAASEILVDDGPDGLLIARLAQRRYWSETQARLLAQRIVWSHVELLKVHADA